MTVLCKLKENTTKRSCIETKDPKEVSEECEYNNEKKKCLTRKKVAKKTTTKKTQKKSSSPMKETANKYTPKKENLIFCKLKQNPKKRTCEKTTNKSEASDECQYNEEKKRCLMAKNVKKVTKLKAPKVEIETKPKHSLKSTFMNDITDETILKFKTHSDIKTAKIADSILLHKNLRENKNHEKKLGNFWLDSEINRLKEL
tara:strand:- start:20002 stop:20604 length:603 start_codon:yes stop_codon:yes gene_type:complete